MLLDKSHWHELGDILIKSASESNRLVYIQNPGNAGDAIIGAATWQFFDQLQIKPKQISLGNICPGDTIIYGGGGNLIDDYKDCANAIKEALAKEIKQFILLPHTIRGWESLLNQLDFRFFVFCRDQPTIDHVKTKSKLAQIYAAPDLALRLDINALKIRTNGISRPARFAQAFYYLPQIRHYFRWKKRLKNAQASTTGQHINVRRVDGESAKQENASPALDISNHYCSIFRNRGEIDLISADLIEFIGRFKSIQTDRLHMGIAMALVGGQVIYEDNSYGKISAIYNFSMKGMPNVKMIK